jgi:cytochrome c-type biogenesis protein CcmH/NrfF
LLLKIFMWLLPVIVVLVIAFFIYMFLKERA